MNYKPIILVAGEPNSVFFEIFLKSIEKNIKTPLILIASYNLLKLQMIKLGFKKKINKINFKNIENYKLDNKKINLIDVKFDQKKSFEKISSKSNSYINKSFNLAFDLINKGYSNKLINGPVSKKFFLKNKYLGVTELISKKYNLKKNAMLIYNKKLSVCPVTTHLPLKLVKKNISKFLIQDKVILINNFFKNKIGFLPRIGVLGLNPHCESISKFNEENKIIKPAIQSLKKLKINVSGPIPADTAFLKKNRDKFDVIIGMYHDQVLTPIKTLFEYDAVNITVGLPFLRISPDHGPNEKMMGKNISNPLSLIRALQFMDKN